MSKMGNFTVISRNIVDLQPASFVMILAKWILRVQI